MDGDQPASALSNVNCERPIIFLKSRSKLTRCSPRWFVAAATQASGTAFSVSRFSIQIPSGALHGIPPPSLPLSRKIPYKPVAYDRRESYGNPIQRRGGIWLAHIEPHCTAA